MDWFKRIDLWVREDGLFVQRLGSERCHIGVKYGPRRWIIVDEEWDEVTQALQGFKADRSQDFNESFYLLSNLTLQEITGVLDTFVYPRAPRMDPISLTESECEAPQSEPEPAAKRDPREPGPLDGPYAAVYAAAYGAAFAQQLLGCPNASHQNTRQAAQLARHIAARAVEYYREQA